MGTVRANWAMKTQSAAAMSVPRARVSMPSACSFSCFTVEEAVFADDEAVGEPAAASDAGVGSGHTWVLPR